MSVIDAAEPSPRAGRAVKQRVVLELWSPDAWGPLWHVERPRMLPRSYELHQISASMGSEQQEGPATFHMAELVGTVWVGGDDHVFKMGYKPLQREQRKPPTNSNLEPVCFVSFTQLHPRAVFNMNYPRSHAPWV